MSLKEEQCHQITVFDWLRYHKLDQIAFHVPNERICSVQQGVIFKRMGVTAGVSDIFIMRASGHYNGLIIELKSMKGRLTIQQTKFLQTMRDEGYDAVVCYGADDAIEKIKDYLEIE